ncbi:MAG TPA: serine--tRNA ligase [Candidatus Saccharimonadales bacterium]|nr:serine--tRNA ligase [Candidatus Saccharimonadales bacterium]
MLDIRFIRENPDLVEEKSKQKGYDVDVRKLLNIDDERRNLIGEAEKVRAERNQLAAKLKAGKPSEQDIARGKDLKENLAQLEDKLNPINEQFDKLLRDVPNITPDDTPLGGEENNKQTKTWGDTSDKKFEVKDHLTWAEERGLLDFERGAKVAGTKFYFTKGSLVELEFAVLQLGLKIAKEHGFEPMLVPHLVSGRIIDGTGYSAKSKEEQQIYKIEDEDLNLIATAEIPLTGYHADEILAASDLPKLYAGYSPAYRMEAGAYGKHSRGLYRVHQFNKLELYVFCKPEESEDWHQKLLAIEEELCQALEIPYEVIRIAAGDLGAPAYKKFDVQYWSPVDKSYRELMSVSNVTDYQARRLNIRYKKADGTIEYLHTLNGTAAAMSRMPIALIENHQDGQGKVHIPKALQPYMHGQAEI